MTISNPPNITLEPCTPSDAPTIATGMYASWPSSIWGKMEPPAQAPTDQSTRHALMTRRMIPSLSEPDYHWLKAVTPSGAVAGMICWIGPEAPIHMPWWRDAIALYGWDERMGWSGEDVDALFGHVDERTFGQANARSVEVRREVMGERKHWYLAIMFTFPEFRGQGVAGKLLGWGIQKADAQDLPIYLESSQAARRLYERWGWRSCGEKAYLRRPRGAVTEEETLEDKVKVD